MVDKIIPQELLDQDELEYLQHGMYADGEVSNYETERLHENGERIVGIAHTK